MQTKIFQKIAFWSFVFLFLALPTVFWIGFDSIFSVAKMGVLYLVTDFLLLCFLLNIWHQKKVVSLRTRWQQYVALFLIAAFLTTLFSINFFSSLWGAEDRFLGLNTIIHVAILGWLFINFFPREKINSLLVISCFAAAAIALYSILQYYGWIKFDDLSWTQNPAKRAFGTLGHANHLGAYLVFNLALTTGLWLWKVRRSIKFLLILSTIVITYALFLSGSRGAFLGLLLTLIIQVFFLWKRSEKFRKKIIFSLIAVAIAGTAFLPFYQQVPLIERFNSGLQNDRISWWKSSWSIYVDKPVLGSGLSTFADIYNQYRRTDYRVPGDLQDGITPEAAHNEFVNILATQGAVGLAAYLLLFGYPLMLLIKKLRDKKIKDKEFFLALSLFGGLLSGLIQTQFNFWVITTFTLFYLILSATILLFDKGKNIKINQRPWIISLKILAIIFILFSTTYTFARLKAEYFLQKGDEAILAQDKEAYYHKAILTFPWEFSYHSKYADYALAAIMSNRPDADFRKYIHLSLSYYQEALKLNEHHPVVWGNYAIALLSYANYQQALDNEEAKLDYQKDGLAAFEYAITIGPNNPLMTYHFALALEKIGFENKAIEYYQKTLQIRANYQDSAERLKKLTS